MPRGPDREWGWMVTDNGTITMVNDTCYGATVAGRWQPVVGMVELGRRHQPLPCRTMA